MYPMHPAVMVREAGSVWNCTRTNDDANVTVASSRPSGTRVKTWSQTRMFLEPLNCSGWAALALHWATDRHFWLSLLQMISLCILYTNTYMYRTCIYRVVPCSDHQTVNKLTVALVNCVDREWPISVEGSSRDSDWSVAGFGARPSERWDSSPPVLPCTEETLRPLPARLSIYKEYARTILCIWVWIFIVQEAL